VTRQKKVWAALLVMSMATACGTNDTGGPPPVDPQSPAAPAGPAPAWYDGPHGGLPAVAQRPRVVYPVMRGVSAPLADLLKRRPTAHLTGGKQHAVPLHRGPSAARIDLSRRKGHVDPVRQTGTRTLAPAPTVSFDGTPNVDGVAPPDPNGDVGPNNYVQWVNLSIAVYDKAGNLLAGPSPGNTPWTGMSGSTCATNNNGDPIVIYDSLADRWVFSQFALGNDGHQCFAISQTPDPLGPYYVYDYLVTTNGINDYPKVALWPDGYYLAVREFLNSGAFTNAVIAYDRESMIQGLPAASVRFDVTDPSLPYMDTVQPAHLEGRALPPAGAPEYLLHAADDETEGSSPDPSQDFYKLWAFHVDWVDPTQSTLTGPTSIPVPEFTNDCYSGCASQKGSSTALDALEGFTMYRLAYRNYGDHESLAVTHSVDAGGGQLGVRWAEVRNPSTTPELFQSGTFAPADGQHRWMGSVAMDASGNLAVGYTVSGDQTYPSARYAARLAGDPIGTLGQGEASIVDGSSTFEGATRWGDYSSMSVDETDDCTFWYTSEYMGTEGGWNWRTHVASFSLPGCQATGVGTIEGTVTDGSGTPLAGASVHAGSSSALSGSDGHYAMHVVPGTYDLTASKIGYLPQTVSGVAVAEGDDVVQDFALEQAPQVQVHGFVYDGSHALWPLYAKVVFTPAGGEPVVTFTDPETGYYAVTLEGGTDYTAVVTSQIPGYDPSTRPITPTSGDMLVSFGLFANEGTCSAPGYTRTITPLVTEAFEAGVPPTGWTVDDSSVNCQDGYPGWTDADPTGYGNTTGGTGLFASADSWGCGSGSTMNTTLTSAPIDLSGFGPDDALRIELDQDFYTFIGGTSAEIDVWNGTDWVPVTVQTATAEGHYVFGTQAANGVADAKVRFVYDSPGWDVWWKIDNVQLSKVSACQYMIGGLVFGNVTDANTGAPINGASIDVGGQHATSFATPDDPNQADGFWWSWVPAAPSLLSVSARHYATTTEQIIPQVNGARRFDVALDAGMIHFDPTSLRIRVPYKGTASVSLDVVNDGGAAATVKFGERQAVIGQRPNGPFAPSRLRVEAEGLREPDAAGDHPIVVPVNARHRDADVARYFPSPVPGIWGIAYDSDTNGAWLSSTAALGGDSALHETVDGVPTGKVIPINYDNVFAADGAYDSRTGMLWQVNVAGDNCIHEVDPTGLVVTSNTICPAFGTTERGLAYDPVTDTFYAGSWTDGNVVQFDTSGTILRSVYEGVNISGLAYNARTGHLFALTNDAAANPDIYVLDASDLSIISTIELTDNGAPAFGDYEQAGLALDCDGNFLAVNQAKSSVVVAPSGEQTSCLQDLPWMSEAPNPVTVPAHATVTVTVSVDAATLTPGLRWAEIDAETDTPYAVDPVPTAVTVAFNDVSASNPDDPYIHALAGAGVTYGCGAGNFCPNKKILRSYYAVWGLRALLGAMYTPPPPQGLLFDDVAPESYGSDFVEDIYSRGLMDACGVGLFCPLDGIPRGQGAQIVLRTLEGPSYVPPPAEGLFGDVPTSDPNAAWIEELAHRGIDSGCGGGNFCPDQNLRRRDMARWMVLAYGIPYLPPL